MAGWLRLQDISWAADLITQPLYKDVGNHKALKRLALVPSFLRRVREDHFCVDIASILIRNPSAFVIVK